MLHRIPVPVAHGKGHSEQGRNTVDQGSQGAHGDQGVHIGRAVPQSLQAPAVVHPVQVDDRQGQEKLQQGRHQGILGTVVPVWGRNTHHMAHGEIHQDHQQNGGTDDPYLHVPQGIVSLGGFLLLGLLSSQGRAVACVGHGFDDRLRHGGAFCLHGHGARQQVYLRFRNTRYTSCHLFHPGRAGSAGHTGHIEFQFHGHPSFLFLLSMILVDSSMRKCSVFAKRLPLALRP